MKAKVFGEAEFFGKNVLSPPLLYSQSLSELPHNFVLMFRRSLLSAWHSRTFPWIT